MHIYVVFFILSVVCVFGVGWIIFIWRDKINQISERYYWELKIDSTPVDIYQHIEDIFLTDRLSAFQILLPDLNNGHTDRLKYVGVRFKFTDDSVIPECELHYVEIIKRKLKEE